LYGKHLREGKTSLDWDEGVDVDVDEDKDRGRGAWQRQRAGLKLWQVLEFGILLTEPERLFL